ncbi:hypothetical protein B484DRAFT_136458 [Ochromonadaceae sp. CCMP2298]|nr:hypothetical protein B484DRAFT_136458 [Ochromonadaceae sp. CCMP2298]
MWKWMCQRTSQSLCFLQIEDSICSPIIDRRLSQATPFVAMQTREVTEILNVLSDRITRLESKVAKLQVGYDDLSERGYDSLRSGEDTHSDFHFTSLDMSDLVGKVVYTKEDLLKFKPNRGYTSPPRGLKGFTSIVVHDAEEDLVPIHMLPPAPGLTVKKSSKAAVNGSGVKHAPMQHAPAPNPAPYPAPDNSDKKNAKGKQRVGKYSAGRSVTVTHGSTHSSPRSRASPENQKEVVEKGPRGPLVPSPLIDARTEVKYGLLVQYPTDA